MPRTRASARSARADLAVAQLARREQDLVLDELHPQLGDLVHDLELQLVVTAELVCALLQRQQLLGADVLLVVGQRRASHRASL